MGRKPKEAGATGGFGEVAVDDGVLERRLDELEPVGTELESELEPLAAWSRWPGGGGGVAT